MERNISLYTQDILDAIKHIKEYTKDYSYDKFIKDEKTQDAVVRQLCIIGEAVKNLPVELKNINPEISWKAIIGTRDILIHDYAKTDIDQVWDIIKQDLDKLEKVIKKISLKL